MEINNFFGLQFDTDNLKEKINFVPTFYGFLLIKEKMGVALSLKVIKEIHFYLETIFSLLSLSFSQHSSLESFECKSYKDQSSWQEITITVQSFIVIGCNEKEDPVRGDCRLSLFKIILFSD